MMCGSIHESMSSRGRVRFAPSAWSLPLTLPLLVATMLMSPAAGSEASTDALRSLKGADGASEARAAVAALVEEGADGLIPVLQGFEGATPLGANWLRSAFDTIAEAEVKAGRSLPAELLTDFILDTSNAPAARRLAYEWLQRQDESIEAKLIPGLLEDAQPEFRRDAVALLIAQAEEAEGAAATGLYREALKGAVDDDQVTTIADALKEAGEPVDLQKHFGFLPAWKIIGPFDNRDMKGYAVAYPPEAEQDLEAAYEGQLGEVRWQDISTDDGYGIVDIGEQIENYKGSLMYALTTWSSAADQEVEFRLGTPNAWKLWVNGELVFEREEYHRSTRMDQYRIPVSLKEGNNQILLKVCQNEQEESWAQDYQYQLRVSDSSGAAIAAAGESDE